MHCLAVVKLPFIAFMYDGTYYIISLSPIFVCFNSNICTDKVAVIHQIYPRTDDYHCHCPNTRLSCTYPGTAISEAFYVLVNGFQHNCNGYTDHEVKLSNGALFLTVNATDSSVNGNNYICTAVYEDKSTATSEIWTLADYEGLL